MDPELAEALSPVLADWRSAGMVEPRIGAGSGGWVDEPGWARAMVWWPGGRGAGVQVRTGRPLADRVVEAAECFQETATECRWSLGMPTNWPPCPTHPTTHPLRAVAVGRDARWSCPLDGTTFGRVGGG